MKHNEKHFIRPRLDMSAKHPDIDTALPDYPTAIMPVINTDPVTPIPDTTSLVPFFRGTMPLPPSINQAYKIVKIGNYLRIGPTPALEQFKIAAQKTLSEASCVDYNQLVRIQQSRQHTPLAVRINAYFSSLWKRDLDGVIKASIDAACAYLKINDNQILYQESEKFADAKDPRIEIEIRCYLR